jgi:hypothetical protein
MHLKTLCDQLSIMYSSQFNRIDKRCIVNTEAVQNGLPWLWQQHIMQTTIQYMDYRAVRKTEREHKNAHPD